MESCGVGKSRRIRWIDHFSMWKLAEVIFWVSHHPMELVELAGVWLSSEDLSFFAVTKWVHLTGHRVMALLIPLLELLLIYWWVSKTIANAPVLVDGEGAHPIRQAGHILTRQVPQGFSVRGCSCNAHDIHSIAPRPYPKDISRLTTTAICWTWQRDFHREILQFNTMLALRMDGKKFSSACSWIEASNSRIPGLVSSFSAIPA